jgi:PIN domain nuclease of toxin-antitoxin system
MILLDTQAVVWMVTRPQRLSAPAARAIRKHAARNELAVASATLMELGQMLASGDIRPSGTPREWLKALVERTPVCVREVTPDVAVVAAYLPPTFPSDPFDRLIAATAIVERLALVTSDERIRASRVVGTIW